MSIVSKAQGSVAPSVAIPGVTITTELPNRCALCQSEATPLFRVDGALIVRCTSCGLVRQDTRPASPGEFYDSAYYATDNPKGGYSNYFLDADVNRRTFQRRLRAGWGHFLTPADVGAALGDFVLEAQEAGWQAEGVEISGYAAARARGRGAVVHAGVLEALRLPAARFDAITLYDTIEHLTDPVATLREIQRLLVPGGLLHVITPNVGGFQARVLGTRWYHYKPGEHLFYFSPSTLRAAIDRAGLSWEGWARAGSYLTLTYVFDRLRYYAPRPFGMLQSLGRKLRFGPFTFYLHVGEMEAWARRES